MLFPYQRHNMSRPGLLDDFLPCDLAELLHGYYTVDNLKQAKLSPMVTSPYSSYDTVICLGNWGNATVAVCVL
jgi:hypothetical protein